MLQLQPGWPLQAILPLKNYEPAMVNMNIQDDDTYEEQDEDELETTVGLMVPEPHPHLPRYLFHFLVMTLQTN